MTIYFIRHGNNLKETYQNHNGSLSTIGIEQAKLSGKLLKEFNIDLIISSTYQRTHETAEIINNELKLPIIFSNNFTEIKLPTAIMDVKSDDKNAANINQLILQNFHNNEWRHSDEENFEDTKQRALKAIQEIREYENKTILIVSHAGFIKRIIAVLAFGKDISSYEYEKHLKIFSIANCGITCLKFDNDKVKIKTWNNISHLKDLETY